MLAGGGGDPHSQGGAVFATAESGDMSRIVIGGRTGSPDGCSGQYGAVPPRCWYQVNGILGTSAPGTTQGHVRIRGFPATTLSWPTAASTTEGPTCPSGSRRYCPHEAGESLPTAVGRRECGGSRRAESVHGRRPRWRALLHEQSLDRSRSNPSAMGRLPAAAAGLVGTSFRLPSRGILFPSLRCPRIPPPLPLRLSPLLPLHLPDSPSRPRIPPPRLSALAPR